MAALTNLALVFRLSSFVSATGHERKPSHALARRAEAGRLRGGGGSKALLRVRACIGRVVGQVVDLGAVAANIALDRKIRRARAVTRSRPTLTCRRHDL